MNVFNTLSQINVNEHIQSKSGLKYLPWAFAWSELMKVYPESNYELLEPKYFEDQTCEVSVKLTVEAIDRIMTLPVMDYKNSAIPNPSARQISDARMRCLVKCIAMFGLGIYIYAGEDIPEVSIKQQQETLGQMLEAIEAKDSMGLSQIWHELSRDEQNQYWKLINTQQKAAARKLLSEVAIKEAAYPQS